MTLKIAIEPEVNQDLPSGLSIVMDFEVMISRELGTFIRNYVGS
jgi:hypothetical protein